MHRILGATFEPVTVVSELAAAAPLLAESPPFLLIAEHAQLGNDLGAASSPPPVTGSGRRACRCSRTRPPPTSARRSEWLADQPPVNPMPLFAEDLTVTALKLLHRDIFGLEKYLAWGVVPRVRTVVAGGAPVAAS